MASDATDPQDGAGKPCLEQRFSPLLVVRTTLHDDGLVVQVARPFRERVGAVDFGRLVLEPASVRGVSSGALWLAGALLAAGIAACLPFAHEAVGDGRAGASAAVLLVGAALALVGALACPRHLTLLLDRERALNPVFLRGGADDAQVDVFLAEVRRAAIAWRCRPEPEPEDAEPSAPRRRLSDALDALHAMHGDGLLESDELARFREIAQRPA
ncbi:MAG TPA: hypothetical protein VFY71_03830 [Planctomycetota bacterium]|nr:hypothetical protein [Planctomycetota bacterium]